MVGVGFTLFFSGLIGWVGGASESPCLVRLFLLSALLAIVAEIGGIIALNILGLEGGHYLPVTQLNPLTILACTLHERSKVVKCYTPRLTRHPGTQV